MLTEMLTYVKVSSSKGRILLSLATILIWLGALAFALDVPLAIWLQEHEMPSELLKPIKFAEIGGHGTGAAMVLFAAIYLARKAESIPHRRRQQVRLIAATYVGSLVVDGLKLVVPRVRPRFADFTVALNAQDTFGSQLLEFGEHSKAALMSFPSGHSAVAAGLAAALCWFHPPGRLVYLTLAILASLQRIIHGWHYLSDVLIGAGIGLMGSWLVLHRQQAPMNRGQSAGDQSHAGF
jgi:membrane-associated phospholipid phosphatase